MSEESSKHPGRYDTTGNPEAEYVDEARTVLVNKLGIVSIDELLRFEEQRLTSAYRALFASVRKDTSITNDLIREAHRLIFGDLYDWAGQWRTVWISKPGTTWPPPDFLNQTMQDFESAVLAKYPAALLVNDEAFWQAIAEIQGEFLVIHPFREGNARTIKLVSDLIGAQTQRPVLEYDTSEAGVQAYIEAAKAAFKKNYAPLKAIIQQASRPAR